MYIAEILDKEKILEATNFITDSQLKNILKFANTFKGWETGTVIDANNTQKVDKYQRNSQNHIIGQNDSCYQTIREISEKIWIELYGSIEEGERRGSAFDLVKYGVGEDLKIHSDYFPDNRENNRKYSVIIYLQNAKSGGKTTFPNLGLTVFPEPKKALFFDNLNDDGTGNTNMLHIGEKVNEGEKIILVMFLNRF